MDPLSIMGGVGAGAGLIVTITKTVKGLSDIQSKYTESEMSIRQLIRQLISIKASITAIQDWTELNLSGVPRERDLVEAFKTSFEGCKEALDAMSEEVEKLVRDALAGDRRTMRFRYLWNEESMKDHQDRLDRQVVALQLLLTAVQIREASEQTALLREPKNQQLVEKIRDDTTSLRAASTRGSVARSSTIVSNGNHTIGSTEFDMDGSLVNTDVYRRAMKGHQRTRSADDRHSRNKEGNSPVTMDGVTRFPSSDHSSTERAESSDHLSPIDAFNRRFGRPGPYERSVASDPANVPRPRRPHVNITSVSDTFLPGLNTPTKGKLQKKRSFLPSLFTGSSNSLLPVSPQDGPRASNLRRGRRHSDTDIHRSIDLNSTDGRNAPHLVQAAQIGSGNEIEELLDQGADIESRHEGTRRTALAVASHCGNDDVVAILLHRQANPNVVDALGMTPLHLASARGHYRCVEDLLREDVDVDAPGPEKKTALRLAADNGHVEVVKLLLDHRAKVNSRDSHNLTALHSAAKLGDEDIVNLLISYKADIEAKDGEFQAAIHHASEKGRDRIVEILLSKKADIEALGKDSKSPLTAACSVGSADVVKLLLQKKASLKHRGENAMTALHWASQNGHSDVVDLLLERRVSIDAKMNDGKTPLHLAVANDKFAVAELLLRKGASIEAYCQRQLRPLHYAAMSDLGVVQLLLGHGADIEAQENVGKRPLHYATMAGNTAMIELLLQKGASIDARDGVGDRPLCLAADEGNLEIVRLLLSRGAAMRTRYTKGPSHEDSPLCIAAKNGHLPVVQELVLRGASVRQKDEANWQPLRYAAYYGHPEVVQFLIDCGASISSLENPGSFGFNLTASRIGFAPQANIDEYRRQSVLNLLHDAEVREQESINNNPRRYPSVRSPQEGIAEKANDYDDGSTVYQPAAERQELPTFQRSPREIPPPYHAPPASNGPQVNQRGAESSQRVPTPPRPRSPPVSQASRFTLDPNSSFTPHWTTVPPPIPSAISVSSFGVSPLPPDIRTHDYSSPSGVSPFASRSPPRSPPRSPQRSPAIPQSPNRPPPPIPSSHSPNRSPPPIPAAQPPAQPVSRHDSKRESDSTTQSTHWPRPPTPRFPTRSPPLPPTATLPPVPDPGDAIVVCDDCSRRGVSTTDLSCSGCRDVLFMYHHVMSETTDGLGVQLRETRASDLPTWTPVGMVAEME